MELNQYEIESYCKSEGLNTEYFIASKNRRERHTKRNRDSDGLTRGR
jgi:hypothetical protein